MIIIVWLLSATISIPPIIATMLGSDELRMFNALQQCELSKNKVYVIYSACGSFYIPALIMTAVYAQVFIETRKRFRERAKGLFTHLSIETLASSHIAAEKLANATRTHKNLPMNSQLIDHHAKFSLVSTIMQPTGSLLKYSASNGSGLENFSTDDAEEALCSKVECPRSLPVYNSLLNDQFTSSRRSARSISQVSLAISVDESKRFSISK